MNARSPETLPDAGSPGDAPSPHRLPGGTVGMAFVLAVVFTALCLQWSLSHGRLSQDPTYDDCAYLYDGGKRLLTLYEQGFGAFLSEAAKDPPHAPLSAFGAMIAFALGGLHDPAPYVLNGLLVFAFLLLVGYLGGALPPRWRGALMFLALTVPVTVGMVHDFRPDAMCALCTVAGVYFVVEAGVYWTGSAQRRALVIGGAAFGLALWAKPAVFPLTLLTAGLSAGGAWLAAALFDPSARSPRRALGIGAAVALPCVLVVAPYAAVGGVATVRYFVEASFGQDNQFTKLGGALAESLRFYTVGPTGAMLLGKGVLLWLALYAVFLGWLVWRRHWRELVLQALLLALAGVALAVVVYGRINNPFFGVTYALLLVVVCLRAGAFVMRTLPPGRWQAASGAALCGVVAFVDLLALPLPEIWPHHHPVVDEIVGHGHSINQRILDDIERDLASHPLAPGQRAATFLMVTGFINEATLRWMALQQGNRPLAFYDLQRATEVGPFRAALTTASYVVSGEENTGGLFQMMPPYKIRAELGNLAADEERAGHLRLLGSYLTPDGGSYRLWASVSRPGQTAGVFSPFADWEGFLPFEGPYAEYHGGRVRWALGTRSEFTFFASAPGAARLDLWARAVVPVHAKVLLNGEPAGELVIPVEPEFRRIDVPVSLRAGANRFAFVSSDEPPAASDGHRRLMIFSQMVIEPAP